MAEEQAFFSDGIVRLSKLAVIIMPAPEWTITIVVPPILVCRLGSHFLTLPCGVDLILVLNKHDHGNQKIDCQLEICHFTSYKHYPIVLSSHFVCWRHISGHWKMKAG